MQLPNFITTYTSRIKPDTAFLVVGIFAAVFAVSAGTTSVFLGSHLTKTEAATEEPKVTQAPFIAPVLEAQAAVVYDLTTGQVIFEKNATQQLPLASLTKLITVLTASKHVALAETVTVSAGALNEEGDSGFRLGEQFTFDSAARLALVASSNDAAEAIAEITAAKQQLASTKNRGLMAGTISSLGLSQTYATNATGLDESTSRSGAYGTAKDVAHIAASVLTTLPAIANATTEPQVSATSKTGDVHTLANTNPTVSRIPGVLLSKTGYTDLAGGNLVMIFDIGINHPVAIVVLGSSRDGRFTDVIKLRESLVSTYLPS